MSKKPPKPVFGATKDDDLVRLLEMLETCEDQKQSANTAKLDEEDTSVDEDKIALVIYLSFQALMHNTNFFQTISVGDKSQIYVSNGTYVSAMNGGKGAPNRGRKRQSRVHIFGDKSGHMKM